MTKDNDELKDGEKVRVPLLMMDNQTAHSHRPGYRVSAKMLTDSEARERLADAYQSYEDDLCSRYRNASPEPVMAAPDASPILDEGFDLDDSDLREIAYRLYDEEISSKWKGK